MRTLTPGLAVAVVFTTVFGSAVPSATSATYAAKGLTAIDGDSVNVVFPNGLEQEVRLLSVDAPEKDQVFADEAREFLERAVAGKSLELTTGPQERDRYGRLLAFVVSDAGFVNRRMVAEGLAVVFVVPPNTERVDELLAAQQMAHREKRGIWVLEGEMEEPASFRARKRGGADTPRLLLYGNFVPVGNRKSRVAHWPGCRHVDEMAPANRRPFASVQEALAAGYRMEKGRR